MYRFLPSPSREYYNRPKRFQDAWLFLQSWFLLAALRADLTEAVLIEPGALALKGFWIGGSISWTASGRHILPSLVSVVIHE